ncbi:hypothetical protein EPYR_03580 [Erwinia pyrifoliae DSM 12163]|nr:hypothetical protein EPYR_03580 [Erwinia pyrifoliae DSM 12163]
MTHHKSGSSSMIQTKTANKIVINTAAEPMSFARPARGWIS